MEKSEETIPDVIGCCIELEWIKEGWMWVLLIADFRCVGPVLPFVDSALSLLGEIRR